MDKQQLIKDFSKAWYADRQEEFREPEFGMIDPYAIACWFFDYFKQQISPNMKIYYARPISLYGTKQDERDLKFLEAMGFEVNNPNKAELVERYKTEGMEVYFQLVRDSDALAFRAFPDGKLGAGVYKEILVAQESGKLVIELPTITSARVLSVEDTREYLKLLGTR
jgi:hypothetical protein